MDRHRTGGLLQLHPGTGQRFPHGAHAQECAERIEHRLAVGAGHQHLLHTLLHQPVVHLREHFANVLLTPQDM